MKAMKAMKMTAVAAFVIGLALAAPLGGQSKKTYTTPKTPWGDPDLQGVWNDATSTPLQRPNGTMLMAYEFTSATRIIRMNWTQEAPADAWMGWNRGRWDGDTLVIETGGFNAKTWLDQAGHPPTESLHVTERFRRRDFGHMELEITIDDPKAYTKPWTVKQDPVLVPDTELLEFICNENEKDVAHMRPK